MAFIEIVSNCNSGWKMTPNDSNVWMEEHMFSYYPLGDIKVEGKIVKDLMEDLM
jgi:2-oxoglutarate ferredoxin oxidoreductase subunit beta